MSVCNHAGVIFVIMLVSIYYHTGVYLLPYWCLFVTMLVSIYNDIYLSPDSDHPLANTRDSGISDVGRSTTTLYSLAQSTSSGHRSGSEEEGRTGQSGPYSFASPPGEGERAERPYDMASDVANQSAESRQQSASPHEEAAYATPDVQPEETIAPPPYEDVNPSHPPPAYEVATLSISSRNNAEGRGPSRNQQVRNGRLGPL